MKNMKIRTKLIINASIMCALSIVVGIVGIIGLSSVNAADERLYSVNVVSLDLLGSIRENFASQRAGYRNYLIYEAGTEEFASAAATMEALESSMNELIETYLPLIPDQEQKDMFNEFISIYHGEFQIWKDEMRDICAGGKAAEFIPSLGNMTQTVVEIGEKINECYKMNVQDSKAAVENNAAQYRQLVAIVLVILALTIVLSVLLTAYISSIIGKPLVFMADALTQIGTRGDLELDPDTAHSAQTEVIRKDEIGDCARAAVGLIGHLHAISDTLAKIAEGNLTVKAPALSDRDIIGLSVNSVLESLNSMFKEINSSVSQVNSGTRQIADGSQSLAQGTTQQAAAVEELSCSVSEIASKTRGSVDMAERATSLAEAIKRDAEKGNSQMEQMLCAVKEIQEASQSISKVIKVIDDIAFQTNILALNAAVEAARAGSHGKGFAVVAEEVRNLAAKSSGAAKDTGELIANSMRKAELGARIAGETAESLSGIVTGINENRSIVNGITQSFEEQAAAIEQINKGIEQVAHVIQQNSATAQQSAAASEEMSQQSIVLKEMVDHFKITDAGKRTIRGM